MSVAGYAGVDEAWVKSVNTGEVQRVFGEGGREIVFYEDVAGFGERVEDRLAGRGGEG